MCAAKGKERGLYPSDMSDNKPTENDSASKNSSTSSRFFVSQTDPNRPECVRLFQHLWEELGGLYGNTGPCEFRPVDVEGAGAAFVVAWLDDYAVGCGAILPLAPGMCEVKRMFVEPQAHRLGVARAILRELEQTARELGYTTVYLETGNRQPGAIRLYEAAGYNHIERYGRHMDDPLSVCFEKRLG
jgi:putative acetyltransferase